GVRVATFGARAVALAILIGQRNVGTVVVRFVDGKAARIRVVPAETAARCGAERLWELRASRAFLQGGREDARAQAAREAVTISGADEASGEELLYHRVLGSIRRKTDAMANADMRVGNDVQRLCTDEVVVNALGLVREEPLRL